MGAYAQSRSELFFFNNTEDAMKRFNFVLTGITPLLMHCDDPERADQLTAWRKDPGNKNTSVAGDDRSPTWTWQTYLYTDGKHVVVPSDNLMVAIRDAGASIILKRQTTYKRATQTGLLIETPNLLLETPHGAVPTAEIEALPSDAGMDQQIALAERLGFSLFIKRAKVGTSKHVRVRPRFDEWSLRGSILATGSEFTLDIVQQLFAIAGIQKGLCDWRPSSPKSPGPFGRFNAAVSVAEEAVAA